MRDDRDDTSSGAPAMSRREFLSRAAAAGAATVASSFAGGHVTAQLGPIVPIPRVATAPGGGLLYPQQNHVRNMLDTSGFWQFQLDPMEEGEVQGWFNGLPLSRPIAVPCSWNDLFDDARGYLGLAWYSNDLWVSSG